MAAFIVVDVVVAAYYKNLNPRKTLNLAKSQNFPNLKEY